MAWWSRSRPRPEPAPTVPQALNVHLHGVAEAMQSTVDALTAAFRSEIAARDAQIAALRAEIAATNEHLSHVTTRFNSLQGLVNRKISTGKGADPDEVPQTFAPWPPLGGLR